MEFHVNGKEHCYDGDPTKTLLSFLRDDLNITSPKNGCSPQASCGCCTIELDGKAVLSCITPMKRVEGKRVSTIEGFSEYLQRTLGGAFAIKGAVQCGFCIPGIIARAKVFLEKNPSPSDQQIVAALNPHLCRCTGYTKITQAIGFAAAHIREGKEIEIPKFSGKVGTFIPKVDAMKTALGMRPYVDDLRFEETHYGALKYCDHPRARVLKIDTTKARGAAGVVKVLTAQDIPGERVVGLIRKDWPVMIAVGETTNYMGDVVASVVAYSSDNARAALELINVEYEVLTPVSDMHKALEATSPVIHGETNLLDVCVVKRGGEACEVEAECEFVSSGVYETQRIEHAYMEPEVAISRMRGDAIELYSQGQGVYEDQRQIALILNLPVDKINVVLVPNGGGFGGKEDLSVQGHCALMSFTTGKTVKLALNREESIRMSVKRHPLWMDYRVGCDSKGKLKFVKANILGDTGAYASVGMKVLERAAGHATGAYNVPCVDVEAKSVYTNNLPCGAMRGFGANQATFALESCIDELCEKGGFDRWQFRYENALTEGCQTSTGQKLSSGVGVRQTLESLKDVFQSAKYAGIACGIKNTGIGNGMPDSSKVKIYIDRAGKLTVFHGWTEMGQGVDTMALQTVCEELDVNPENVTIKVETSEADAFTGMTTASRATSLVGNALINACSKIKENLKGGDLSQLGGMSFPGEWICDFTTKPGAEKNGEVITHYSYSYATQVVVLDDQGKIDTIYACHDAGKIMNPVLFEGQIEGSLHMGLGYALKENMRCVDSKPVSLKLKDCGVLRAKETPKFVVSGVEVKDQFGPYGAKGVGEIGLVPTAPAVTNALYTFDKKRRYVLPIEGSL